MSGGIGFRDALSAEFTRIRQHPGDTIAVVVINGLLMTFVWFALPRSWFFHFTGPSGYAVALSCWMYADVTATNVLAADSDRVLTFLDDPDTLRTVLRAKETALWLIIAPVCVVAAVVCGYFENDWRYTAVVILTVTVVPIGALAVSGVLGVLFPYHQRPLRWRWRERSRFRPVILRWSVLTVMPFLVYPASAIAILAIPLGIWWLITDIDGSQRLPTSDAAVCALMAMAISGVCWWWAHRFAVTWAARHSDALRDYLSDRERG